jgi:diguanylate cyclase (GGDEF)-like protein
MSGASFILAINIFIAALFALSFFIVALSTKSRRIATSFSFAYGFGIAYLIFEFLLPIHVLPTYAPRLAYVGGFTAFLGATICIFVGIAERYRQPIPARFLVLLVICSVVANYTGYDLERESLARMMAYQAPFALMQALSAWAVFAAKRRQPVDWALMGIFTLGAVQFVSKPFVAGWTGGPGDTAQDYVATVYAMYSQSLGAVLQVAVGLIMLLMLLRDMLVELTTRSETDMLSELYNRRGFEDRVATQMMHARSLERAASLVMADLDAFKSINDSYGHDVGDSVIMAFAALLRDATPSHGIAARMGGEEFAIYLPDTNLGAARLFAEAVRVKFGTLAIESLPQGRFCTASFGVAESMPGESYADLRRRADAALYAAKRGGRDLVAVSELPFDQMPVHPLATTTISRSA